MLNLLYRRPKTSSSAASVKSSFVAEEDVEKYIHRSSSVPESINIAGIPQSLSFERIVSGGTCPPVTTKDFMNYLMYVQFSAEELQFWLWIRDYETRFESLGEHKSLSPIWTKEKAAEAAIQASAPKSPSTSKNVEINITEAKTSSDSLSSTPWDSPPRTPSARSDNTSSPWDEPELQGHIDKMPANYKETAANALRSADHQWQPTNIQPFRDEIARIIALYIAEGSPRQLNITDRDRKEVLLALAHTTHYSALHNLKNTIEWNLRYQSHPNFIRWAICNGNRPRVIFARGLGVSLILFGVIVAFLTTLSHISRGWRAFSALLFVIGIATLIAAWKGMCVVLHSFHAQQLRPWEIWNLAPCDEEKECDRDDKSICMVDDLDLNKSAYESHPWVVKYEKRNLVRKVFDKQVWIQEPALRQIQDAIFIQSILAAIFTTAVIVGIFLAIPKGNYF